MPGPQGSLAREDDLADPAGQGARRDGHRRGDRRRRVDRLDGRPRAVGARGAVDALAHHHGHPVAIAGLSHRRHPRPGRGPAEEFGKECDGGIAARGKWGLVIGEEVKSGSQLMAATFCST